jgi:uncharacterized membrane protein
MLTRTADPAGHQVQAGGYALGSAVAWCSARRWALVVWVASTAWASALFLVVRSDYADFRLARFDLGNMVQAVWSTAHGRPLEMTLQDGAQSARLAAHVDPILALLAPLWIVFPSPLTVAFVQIAAAALGSLPVFWLARRHLGSERAAAFLALAYLAYPWLCWTAVEAMHPVSFATPLLLYCVWFLDSRRPVPFAIVAVLALASGELIGLTLASLGLWYAVARGQRLAGMVIAGVGLGWTAVALEVVVPSFGGESSPYYGLYESVGGSPTGLVSTVFTDPVAVVSAFGWSWVTYVLLLGAPLAGSFLLAPGMAAVALPQLAVNGLADLHTASDPRYHYIAAVVPILFAASVLGLARLSTPRRTHMAGAVLVLCVATSVLFGPWPHSPFAADGRFRPVLSPRHVDALRDAVALVPSDAPVSSTNGLGSHLSARRYVYSAPVLGRSSWVVVDRSDPWVPAAADGRLQPETLQAMVSRLKRSPSWSKVLDRDGVLVFRRVPEGGG